MTMHLAQGLSTINTRKRKKKPLTQKEIEKYTIEWRRYNKEMRRKHHHDLQYSTVEDYIAYCRGEKRTTSSSRTFIPKKPDINYVRETPKYRSLMEEQMHNGTFHKLGTSGCGTKKKPMKYTGDLITGIATMHKSNAVPVMKGTDQAKDIARMRR